MEERDQDDLFDLKTESWFGTHNTAVISMDDQMRWYHNMLGDKNNMVFIVWDKSNNGRSVGVYKISNIDWINRRYDSAHDVLKDSRGKGYGKTVLEIGVDFGFEVLNMHRLDTEVLANNKASRKCAEYCGYKYEGTKKKCVHKCNEWLDSDVFGLLREDWEDLERVKNYGGVCNTSYTPKDGE